MDGIGEVIEELRLRRSMTKLELAAECDTTESHISHIERGRIKLPKRPTLTKLAKALGVTPEEILERAGYFSRIKQKTQAANEVLEKLRVQPVRIPIIGEAHAGPEGILGPIEDYAYWSRSKAADRNIIGIICRGFCLEPEVREGDIIFIDQDLSADPGDMVLVTVGDEIRLVPWDHGRHDLPADAVIQGVVVEVSRRLK